MIFGMLPLSEAVGAILAHTVRAGAGAIKKGTCLKAGDIKKLEAAGLDSVTAVRLEPGDVREDDVALAVASALCGESVDVAPPLAGRCNLHAREHGVLDIDRETVDALNLTGEGVLCATLPSFETVEPGRTVATVKVIPYAIPQQRSDALLETVGNGAVRVRPFTGKRVGLILTEVAGGKASLLDKAREVLAARVETFGSAIVHDVRTPHADEPLASAIRAAAELVDVVLVLGGASTVDIGDTVPAAIVKAGGEVDLFGIPVDPGNLLAMGRVGDVPVLGLPGCARSPKMNGIDLILPRLFAGLDMGRESLLGLGVGGLLHDVTERPQPREPHPWTPAAAGAGRVAAVVLAAGASRRMGVENKLLKDVGGQPMVRRVAEAALASGVDPVIIVTGHEADQVRQALNGLDVQFVHNPRFEDGLSASVRAGVGHVPEDCVGALMLLGDMPRISADIIDAVIAGFRAHGGQAACVPVSQGRRGNPVLWPREFFPDMLDLSGDVGARQLLQRHGERVVEIDVETTAIFLDVDTPGDLNAL